MTNPKVLEAWFTLMAEAMRGTSEAQDALKILSKMLGTGAPTQGMSGIRDMNDWMTKFMPEVVGSTPDTQPEVFESWLDEWQQVMGVVPRSRYLALLEKYDILQQRFENAEKTIKTLQSMLSGKDNTEAEAKKVVDMWGTMLEDTLKLQTEWIKDLTGKEPDPTED